VSALVFAVVSSTERTELALGQFCRRLSVATGLDISPCVVPSYAALINDTLAGKVQLGWAAPLVAVDLEDRGAVVPLVVLMRGVRAGYHAALFARADRPYRRIEDLQGLTVAWVSRESASGYFVPRWHLRSLGVDVGRAFQRELFCSSHEEVVEAVASGAADVGATHVGLEPVSGQLAAAPWLDLGLPASSMRVLLLVGPIPGDLIVAASSVPAAARQRLVAAFLGLRDDHDGMAQSVFQATRFDPVPDGHLDLLRRLARFAETR
jgi:phosphonate transport system substrate-binding protein